MSNTSKVTKQPNVTSINNTNNKQTNKQQTKQLQSASVKPQAALWPGVSTESRGFSDKYLGSKNLYLATLRDPMGVVGVRIPDGSSPNTAAGQVVYRAILTTNSNGVAGFSMGAVGSLISQGWYMVPQPGIITSVGGVAVEGAIGIMCGTNASLSTPFDTVSTSSGGSIAIAPPQTTNIMGYVVQRARVVSAMLNLTPAAALTSAGGYYVGASLPANYFNGTNLNGTSVSEWANLPGSVMVPVYNPNDPGVTVTYNPADPSCRNFASCIKTSTSYSDPEVNALNPGVLAVMVVGAASTQHVLTICVNYEMILADNMAIFAARPTFNDPLAMATAENARSGDPVAFAGSNLVLESSGIGVGLPFEGQQMTMLQSGASPGLNSKQERSIGVAVPEHLIVHGAFRVHPKTFTVRAGGVQFKKSEGKDRVVASKVIKQVEQEEKPIFESLVDTLGAVVKKGLPKLFPFLSEL
jgi:hypothetical protein